MNNQKCWVVTCIPCNTPFPLEEAPNGCAGCGMMDWLFAFETIEECNNTYKKQHPEKFKDGEYVHVF